MISVRLFLVVTLALAERGLADVSGTFWKSPVSFYYQDKDILNVDLILQNLPREVDHYELYYQTENCIFIKTKIVQQDDMPDRQEEDSCHLVARNGTIPPNKKITIMQPLTKPSIALFIILRYKNKICDTRWIIHGTRARRAEDPFRKSCLNYIKINRCTIATDFGYHDEDSTVSQESNNNTIDKSAVSGNKTHHQSAVSSNKTHHQPAVLAATTSDNLTTTILASVLGVITITVMITAIIVVRTRWSRRGPSDAQRLPTTAPCGPFYVNLLFRDQCAQEIADIENHQYEEIGERPNQVTESPYEEIVPK